MPENEGEENLVDTENPEAEAPEEEPKPKKNYKLKYRFLNNEELLEDGEARSGISDDRLVLLPANGRRFELVYRDILDAKAADYALTLKLKGGETAVIYFLGRDYDSYVGNFFAGYNKIAREDSFMAESAETVRKGAKYKFTKAGMTEEGGCDVAYGKTAVILQRSQAEPARIPFALIERTETTPYSIRYITEGGEWEIYMLADRYQKCMEVFSKNVAERIKASADAVKEAKKDITPLALRKAAELFLDGRAVSKEEAEAVFPGLFDAVYAKSAEYGAGEYFDFLYGKSADTFIGFKKALLSGEEDYLWMLCHIGDFIVLEAASPSKTGRATYVFSSGSDAAGTMRLINYCMHMTEFRREPVYMSERELNKPDNARYLESLRRVPEILTMRKLYIKRVAHTTVDKWKESLFK